MLSRLKRMLSRAPLHTPKPPVVAKASDAVEASLQALGRSRTAQVAPALLLATGAGVAFWWWTQWARGRAESEGARTDTASGED